MSKPASQFYLSRHVYTCLTDNHMVFLDRKNDRYLCLDNRQAPIVWSYLKNRCCCLETEENPALTDMLELLLEKGLLTNNPTSGKDISDVSIAPPSREIPGYDLDKKPEKHAIHIYYFLFSCLTSAIRLRLSSLDLIMHRLEKRTRLYQKTAQKIHKTNLNDLVEIFKSLRPLVFTSDDNCMFSSLALIEFLSHFNIYPKWVFGVKMGPFIAHCWVQIDDLALSDSVDHIAAFTPIMAT